MYLKLWDNKPPVFSRHDFVVKLTFNSSQVQSRVGLEAMKRIRLEEVLRDKKIKPYHEGATSITLELRAVISKEGVMRLMELLHYIIGEVSAVEENPNRKEVELLLTFELSSILDKEF